MSQKKWWLSWEGSLGGVNSTKNVGGTRRFLETCGAREQAQRRQCVQPH